MAAHNKVRTFYQSVIDDVVNNVRESFLDEGMDDQLLQEFKALWETKLNSSKAVEAGVEIGPFSKQHLLQQSHQKQAAATAAASQSKPGAAYTQIPPTLPQSSPIIFNPVTGQLDMSAAATSGQMAAIRGFIPPGMNIAGSQPMQIFLQSGNIAMSQAFAPPTTQSTASSRNQVDGAQDDSSSDDDDDDDDHDNKDDREEQNEEENDEGREDDDPLNSEDDTSEGDPEDLFDTENVVVCQFDKINRTRNKWRFLLKDGIMNLKGKDYLFQKATGDAEW